MRANFKEAQAAESSAGFAHKIQIALKELGETNYWLRVIAKANTPPSSRLALFIDESHQLVAMLSKTVARAKVKAND